VAESREKTCLQDEKLHFSDIVWVHPIFGRLSNEAALASTRSTVTLMWISSRPDNIIQPRQLNNIRIVVILEERLGLQSRCKDRLE